MLRSFADWADGIVLDTDLCRGPERFRFRGFGTNPTQGSQTTVPTNAFFFRQEDNERMAALEQLWQQADSDEDRQQVREMIAEIISDEFDADLKRRQAELDKIVQRVEKLKDQLKRRIQSKDDIVELQVKQTTMTWDGLGWNGAAKGRGRAPMSDLSLIRPKLYSKAASGKTGLAYVANPQPPQGSLAALVRDSALGNQKRLDFLCEQLAERLDEVAADTANKTLWYLYQETKDKVDDSGYWSQLIDAGEAAIDRADNDTLRANTLDTVARMYEQLGDRERALELQEKAAELQPNSGQVKSFLKRLAPAQNKPADELAR